jgi:hypothetical protein
MSAACSATTTAIVDRIAKLIPFELGITLDEALEQGTGTQALCTAR